MLWEDICYRRQLDTCTGLLLARASMLDPRSHRNPMADFIDPLAARSTGSLAWWCHLAMEVLDEPHPIGARLPDEEIETFMSTARDAIAELDK